MFQEVAEEERSKWLKVMLLMAVAGIIIVFAPDIVLFLTGIDIAAPDEDLPEGFTDALQNLLALARYFGAAIIVIGGVIYVIKMEFREGEMNKTRMPQLIRVA